jgi:hypothetical protein
MAAATITGGGTAHTDFRTGGERQDRSADNSGDDAGKQRRAGRQGDAQAQRQRHQKDDQSGGKIISEVVLKPGLK